MADEAIDRLEIQVEAQAKNANAQLELLTKKLSKVSTALSYTSTQGLAQLANGVDLLSDSMLKFKNSTKTADFTRIAKNLNQLSSVNAEGIKNAASAVQSFSSHLSGIQAINIDTVGIINLANAIGKLGGANVSNATNNIPALKNQLIALINAMNGLQTVDVSTTINSLASLTSSISTLGKKASTTAVTNIPQLSTALVEMMQTLSTAPQVSQNLIQMTNALANLASQGNKIPSTYNRITTATNGFVSASKRATTASKSLASAIGALYAKYFLLFRGVKLLWSSVTDATDYIETLNYFEVAVDQVADEAISSWSTSGYDSAQSYYDSFRSRMTELTEKFTGFNIGTDSLTITGEASLGLNVNDILGYQATFLQLANSMGVAEESSLQLSKALTMLSADWSSLRNIDLDTSMEKFASAVVGQTRAVRSFGLDTLQATLQEYAFNLGIEESVTNMTQAEKVYLRVIALLDQSEVAYGDLANTIESPANQVRILKNQFSNLSRTLGSLLVPAITFVLPYINGLTIAINTMLTTLGNFLGVDWSQSISSIAGSTIDLDELTDGLDDVTEASDEAQKSLAGFDTLNILGSSASTESLLSGIDTTTVLSEGLAEALATYEEQWEEAFSNMENKATTVAENINEAFTNFSENIGLSNFIDIAETFTEKIDTEKITESFNNLADAMEPFEQAVGEGLADFFYAMSEIGAGIINNVVPAGLDALTYFANNTDADDITQIAIALTSIATAFALFKTLTKVSTTITALKTAVAALGGVGVAGLSGVALGLYTIGSVIVENINAYKEYDTINKLADAFDDLESTLQTDLSGIDAKYSQIQDMADEYLRLSENYDTLTDSEKGLLKAYSEQLIDYFPDIIENVDSITGAWTGTVDELQAAIDKTKELAKVTAIQDFLTEAYSASAQFKKSLEDAQQALEDIKAEYSDELAPQDTGFYVQSSVDYKNAILSIESATQAYEDSLDTIDYWENYLTDTYSYVYSETGAFKENMEEALIGLNTVYETSGQTMEDAIVGSIVSMLENAKIELEKTGDIKTATEKLESIIQDNITPLEDSIPFSIQNAINGLVDAINDSDTDVSTSMEGLADNVYNSFTKSIKPLVVSLKVDTSDYDKVIASLGSLSSIVNTEIQAYAYADGGLPSTGQFFVARESGPELVGTIGGSSAVVNNDQIVASVANGVAKAVAAVLATSQQTTSQQTEVILQVDKYQFGSAVVNLGGSETKRRGTKLVASKS